MIQCLDEQEKEVVINNMNLGFEHLSVALDYLVYYSRKVIKEGEINIKGNKFYLNDFELNGGDELEFYDGKEWLRTVVFEIGGEYYLDCRPLSVKRDRIKGRVRETTTDNCQNI